MPDGFVKKTQDCHGCPDNQDDVCRFHNARFAAEPRAGECLWSPNESRRVLGRSEEMDGQQIPDRLKASYLALRGTKPQS